MNSAGERARANIDRFVSELGLGGVVVVPYPDYDDGIDCCFILKRLDPRVEDHSKAEVWLTCRVDMPCLEFDGDKVCGRLKKLWVDGGGWLWSLGLGFAREGLEGRGDDA